MSAVAVFENVGKRYAPFWNRKAGIQAVQGVNLHIPQGQIFGLLGPNRAGKTTLIKLLLSLARPTEGKLLRFGEPVMNQKTLARVGYMHENQLFPKYLTAREILHFYGGLSLMKVETLKPRAQELLQLVGLGDRTDEPISRFSKGMVQRLGLAQALINDPELLILDEPTEGLDLLGRQLLRQIVLGQKERKRTVVLVSHVLTEVEQICDRVAVIVGGRLKTVANLADLRKDPKTGQMRSLEEVLQPLYLGAAP